jgi:hypothetical protein
MTEDDGFEVLTEAEIAKTAKAPKRAPRRDALQEIDQQRGRIDRLNTWVSVLHNRIKQLEDTLERQSSKI